MAVLSISVSELKCACLDAGWRQRWLAGERPSTQHFAPLGQPPVAGTSFHALAEQCLRWLVESPAETTALQGADELWHQLFHRFAEVPLDRLANDGKVETALYLSSALQAFCLRLDRLRRETPAFSRWTDLILSQEQRVRDVHFPVGNSSLFLTGTVDAVRLHPRHGLEIVDYKLSRGANLRHDLLQLAIYARMLTLSGGADLQFTGCLEYYLPQLEALEVTAPDLKAIFDDLVEPVLYELTGERPRVLSSPTTAPGSAGDAAPAPVPDELPAVAEKIAACFHAFKLPVEITAWQQAPQLTRYLVQPAAGVRVVSLANRAEDLQIALGLTQPPRIVPSAGGVAIDIPKPRPDTILWREVVSGCGGGRITFPVGVGVDNTLLTADLGAAETCHGLVAGASGSGKSEWLKSVVATLIHRNDPAALRLSLIDPKRLTFAGIEGAPHLLHPVLTDIEAALRCLDEAGKEMESRYELLARERFTNLGERQAAGRWDLPYRVIVFDEFADLILSGRAEKKQFETSVSRLAAKGRAAGIHLLLATQRPDKDIVTGLIKANLPLRVCLRVTSAVNSQIVLDEPGAENLLGRGDLLCDRGRWVQRAQAPLVTAEDWSRLIRPSGEGPDPAEARGAAT